MEAEVSELIGAERGARTYANDTAKNNFQRTGTPTLPRPQPCAPPKRTPEPTRVSAPHELKVPLGDGRCYPSVSRYPVGCPNSLRPSGTTVFAAEIEFAHATGFR